MIKNLLYSLFLHFLLLLLVYANFNLKNVTPKKSNEISVSLISLAGSQDADQSKVSENIPTPEVKKEQPEPEKVPAKAKEVKSQKKSDKNKVASEPKKIAKAKAAKSITKPIESQVKKEVKEFTKPEEKQEDNEKPKQDEISNDHKDDKKVIETKKDQDLGSQKKSEEVQEVSDKKSKQSSAESSKVNNLENIDLSAREKFNIQSQLKRCYSRVVLETNYKGKDSVMIQVSISEEGVIDYDIEDTIDMEKYNEDKSYKTAVDNAKRAIDLCSPLRNLPIDKYDVWKDVVLNFGETKE